MRIQNNIMAMNTHRQYTINNDSVSKSAEKLSSGYRINRAGDDAAGLAISEKMRSQIRGLNMATKNSQDAISLVQTAEGALQETHSMLQRMNELADQSATGTNQELDRNALAKEFEQLKREINDVAEQTTFNNMKILDGSLSYEGPQRSAATAGINVNESIDAAKNGALTSTITTKGVEAVTAAKAKYEIDLSGQTALTEDGKISVTIAGKTVSADIAVATDNDTTKQVAKLQAALSASTDPVLSNYTITAAAGKLTFEAKTAGKDDFQSAMIQGVTAGFGKGTVANVTVEGVDAVTAAAGVTTASVDVKDLKLGDEITVGGRTFQLIAAGDEAEAGNVGIEWDDSKTIDDLVTGLNQVDGVTVAKGADDFHFTVTQDTAGEGEYGVKFQAAAATKSTIEMDIVKLKEGDVISVENKGKEYTYEFKAGDSVENIMQGLMDDEGNAIDATLKGSAIIVEGKVDVMTGFEPVEETDYNAIRIQVGALEGEQLSVSIDSMNTKGLGLDGIDIQTQDSAGKAITAVRDAINKVSDQRATLGAMQNRLDHKIANLKVSAENLSAAESRIRDVDIASEMTSFTKSNILSQAATAMLAQANSLPQNVLSLLR